MIRRSRCDEGLTLIEVLVTVVILGVAFVTVVGGMAVSIAGSDMHRKQATSQTVLRNLAEYMKAAPYVADPCPADYSSALVDFSNQVEEPPTAPSSNPQDGATYTVEIVEPIEVWAGQGFVPAPRTTACTDTGLQRLTLQVRSVARPDLSPETLAVVKRAP